MRLTTDRMRLVMDYGLTEYQARAYLALLENPMATAGVLARLSRVPRNRLYGVLEDLQRMGLAEIHLNEKRQYRARLFSGYLTKRIEALDEEITEIRGRRDYIDSVLTPLEPEEDARAGVGTTRVIRGRRSITEEVEALLARAQARVVMVLTANAAVRFEESLAERVTLGREAGALPDIVLFLPREAYQTGTAERLNHVLPGCTRMMGDARAGITVLVDDTEVLFVHPVPDDTRGASSSDFAFSSTNPALVADAAANVALMERLRDAASGADRGNADAIPRALLARE